MVRGVKKQSFSGPDDLFSILSRTYYLKITEATVTSGSIGHGLASLSFIVIPLYPWL